jgi:hypothetical protein
MALLIVLIALLMFSVIGMYLALAATAEMRISDNFESYYRARLEALAGMNHARVLLRGLCFDDQLRGPDGTYGTSAAYFSSARAFSFRMPVAPSRARIMDILNPGGVLSGISDDGILNSGKHPGGNGTVLIPPTGIAHTIANPESGASAIAGRYFVKASDNNGEAGELASDPGNNPFFDGDGQIILRSMGIARTLGESMNAAIRKNTVAVYEGRFKRFLTYELDAPVVVQANAIAPAREKVFAGVDFLIQGGSAAPGIAVIDPQPGEGLAPAEQVRSRLGPDQAGCLQGAGGAPSVLDITSAIATDADKKLLLDETASWRFLRVTLPQFADNIHSGNQSWIGSAPASLGSYDSGLPSTSPVQDPRVTVVDGDLLADGSLSGAGILVVTGRAAIKGNFSFKGMILVLGAGEIDIGGWTSISGGVFIAGLSKEQEIISWGTAKLSVGGNARIQFNQDLVRMAVNLMPPAMLSLREITGAIDP